MEYVVSYFPNVSGKKVCDMPLTEVFTRIREGAIKSHIEAIRRESNVTKREMLKRQTPAITLSGTFCESHAMKDFQTHSGLVQVDFDKLDSPKEAKECLVKDKYTFGCFTSPSGKGVKAIVKIPNNRNLHEKSFEDLARYYQATYGYKMDRKCKDISRLCFLSYDPELFVNHQSLLFEPEPAQPRNHFNSSPFPPTDELETEVERIVSLIESDKLDITRDYDTWLKLGFALANGFGETGLHFYKRISRFYPGYSDTDCEKQFYACLHGNRHGITIKTFFQIAKNHGILIRKSSSFQTKAESRSSALEEASVSNIRDHEPEIFYTPVYGKDNDGNSVISDVRINYRKFIDLLYSWGFRRFDMDKQFFFVHVQKQIVKEVTPIQIQDYFISWLKSLPKVLDFNIHRDYIIEKIYKSPSTYFCESKLSLLKSESAIVFNADNKEEAFIYYRNGFVRCTGSGYTVLEYDKLKNHVWFAQILPRAFEYKEQKDCPIEELGVFARFAFNIANKDVNRFLALCSILGYNLHTYFDQKLKATIITDSRISDKPDGRTGKTLLCRGLGRIKNYCEVNGKDFDPSNKHKYEQANLDTQVICLNDVRRTFDFESLYNDITEHVTVNRKNQQPFNIKAKLVVTTNKTVLTEGASSKDRSIEFELSEYYNERFSPQHEFGQWFFSDWSEQEWIEFDNFMMFCICLFLERGVIETAPINLHKRKIIDYTCPEFVEFMQDHIKDGSLIPGQEYDKKAIYTQFINEYPDLLEHRHFGKQSTFSKFLKTYCRYSDEFEDELIERKSMSNRYFMIKSKITNEKK